jgi:hypothetical protein
LLPLNTKSSIVTILKQQLELLEMAYATLNGKLVKKNKANANKKRRLIGYYWGYNAEHKGEGFEFSNLHARGLGLPMDAALEMGQTIKDACEAQIKLLEKGEYGEVDTLEEYLDEEQKSLDEVINALKARNYKADGEKMVQYIVVACSAISSLVHYGRIQQNNWNGVTFMYESK